MSPRREVWDLMFDRISINPQVCHGQACIRGTRIPVHQVLRMLANGDSVEELIQDYPSLEREDIQEALNYAAALTEEQVIPIDQMPQA
jgi:uncharacterized protein (DUF433 family)